MNEAGEKIATDVSIIIVNYNSTDYLVGCLNSIISQSTAVAYEIIVVDNNSIQGDLCKIKNQFPSIQLINIDKNVGFASANNVGIKQAEGKYIFLLNPDIKLLNDCIKIFYDFLQQHQEAWCCGGNVEDEFGNPANSWGKLPTITKVFFEQTGFHLIFKSIYKKFQRIYPGNNKSVMEVPFIIGADMFIRKSSLDIIGLFNESFFLNCEETELSFRANKSGFKSFLIPSARLIHYVSKSFSSKEEYFYHLRKSEVQLFKLLYPGIKYHIVKYLMIYGALVRYIISGNRIHLKLVKEIIKR